MWDSECRDGSSSLVLVTEVDNCAPYHSLILFWELEHPEFSQGVMPFREREVF